MISRILYVGQYALTYTKRHPQILFALLLIIVIPLIFLYSGQKFLDVGRLNQDRLQSDRIGLMHDVFVSLVLNNRTQPEILQTEITRIAELNPDIKKFRVAKFEAGEIIPVAALDLDIVGVPEAEIALYQSSAVRFDESITYEFFADGTRLWQSFRAMQDDAGAIYYIFTELSFEAIDSVMHERERGAYYSLIIIYLFVLLIAYWQIKITDYRYLYTEAKKANEMKDLFTNMIAHELRAPLTAIRGYASMIEESDKVHEKEGEYVIRIRESSERLLSIVNDLLDVARIQSGKLSVDIKKTNISEVIVAVTDELRSSAIEKNITLSHSGSETMHEAITDSKRLHQAITNLLSNAIKYTKEGAIDISIEEQVTAVEIRIKDTGMGISAKDQKKLFAPFYRVESDDVSAITGTGLGMWITKQLIEMMKATIAVESIKGVGTHIVVRLPK